LDVVKHAAFALSPPTFDALVLLFRARGYHHIFDVETGAMYLDNIAFTRADGVFAEAQGSAAKTAWLIENGESETDRRYYSMKPYGWTWTDKVDLSLHFSRQRDALAVIGASGGPGWVAREHSWG
jgi:hypothetical protein